MSFPIINFKATNTELDMALQDLVTQKFTSLEKFLGNETDVKCDVEFEKVSAQQSGAVHRVEANLWLAGTLHRADATEHSFEEAVDEVRNELDKELRRSNDKKSSLLKRGGRKIKEMLRFG
ncbi:MAG: ribosome-associated translation inhibitor RaiA [Patescibacteria group bacterium]